MVGKIDGNLRLDYANHVASLDLMDGGQPITVPMIVDPTHTAPYTKQAAAAAYAIYQNYALPCMIGVKGVLTTDENGFRCIHL